MKEVNPSEMFLIRHGETVSNLNGAVQGLSDSPLTEKGMASTLVKAEKVRPFRFDAVYCSDLPRARRTFDLLAEALPSLPRASFTSRLRDIDFGSLTGKPKREIMETILKHKANPHLNYPGGESGARFVDRVRGFFLEARDAHAGQRVLVVSHYGVMETAAHLFGGAPADERIAVGPEDVWVMKFNGVHVELEVM